METSIEDIDKIDADINDEMSHQTLKLIVLSSEILLDSDLSPFAVSLKIHCIINSISNLCVLYLWL